MPATASTPPSPTSPKLSPGLPKPLAAAAVSDPSRADRINRAPLTDQLERLAQFTIAVQFDLNSARIRPDSFRAVGLMADALNHPYLYGYRFLIIGHADGDINDDDNEELCPLLQVKSIGVGTLRFESVYRNS